MALCSFFTTSILIAQPALTRFTFTHPQMGTVFRLVFYAKDSTTAQKAAAMAFARVDTLNQILSDYLPESETNRLCALAGMGKKTKVSRDLWYVLRQSRKFSRKTDGAFDVTIGSLTRLWRRSRSLKVLPDSTRLQTALAVTDYRLVRFYPLRRAVALTRSGMQLDFGGIAQGYAADECLKVLRSFGIKSALADAGGDLSLGDPPPDAGGWSVEIPGADGKTETLLLSRCGITTSGARYRYTEVNGKRYSHIIDPKTGWGLTHRILVTVLAPDGITADVWATALSISGPHAEKMKRKAQKNACYRVWMVEMPL